MENQKKLLKSEKQLDNFKISHLQNINLNIKSSKLISKAKNKKEPLAVKNAKNNNSKNSSKNQNKSKKTPKQSKVKLIRALYLIGGFISLGLGCLGIPLPVLPTVPFFLLTAFCFAKGSIKFHDWFIKSKLYKKYVSGFAEHKAMSIGGELSLMIIVTTMLIIACLMCPDILAMAIIIPLLIACKYAYFIFKVKTVSKDELKKIKASKTQEVL